jgi:hypothetical protein
MLPRSTEWSGAAVVVWAPRSLINLAMWTRKGRFRTNVIPGHVGVVLDEQLVDCAPDPRRLSEGDGGVAFVGAISPAFH